ncbi:MAG: type II toxin-antitoxin system VapC family toxin [Chloroflexota bacterium]|nr:type II toxin-antitoxin system VapC family toxin [Chloroflexota bacterium]MDE2885556.1 type II toxin-antitoxin system VapC family toxin [Chloroflexota bacterium]
MIVVDASAVVAFVTGQRPDGAWVREQLWDQRLLSTHVMPAEVHNALRRMELSGDFSTADTRDARAEFLGIRFELAPFRPYANRVWELRRNLSGYDAWYVALAEALDCPLVTIDHRLSRAVGPECTFVTPPDA